MPDEENGTRGARPLRKGFGDGQNGDRAGAVVVRAVADMIAINRAALSAFVGIADVIIMRAHRDVLLLERLVTAHKYADDVLRELSLGRHVHSQLYDLVRREREGRLRFPFLRGR